MTLLSNSHFRSSTLFLLIVSLLWGQGRIAQSSEPPHLNTLEVQSNDTKQNDSSQACPDLTLATDPSSDIASVPGTDLASAGHQAAEGDERPAFTATLSPQYPPPELNWLDPRVTPPQGLTTSNTISLQGLTPPSLWWTDQQFGGKTLKGWIAYPGTETLPPRVDLVVNRQLWGLSDYLERYSFVHHFGRAAQCFGYTIRVFNDVGDPLAIYPCPINPCSIILNSSGIGALQDSSPF
ncbi:MAG: hypothetical protein AAGD25_19105 [Cyanobacteria bacterium P01_F01_bin.150]